MTLLSYFQTLPDFLAKEILGYLLSSSDESKRDIFLTLLQSCSLWRFLCIEAALSTLEIGLQYKKPVEIRYPRWPKNVALPSRQTRSLAKRVKLHYHGWVAAHSNNSVDLLRAALPDSDRLVSVNSIELVITLDRNYETASTLDKLDAVIGYIWYLVPNVRSVCIDCKLTDFFYTDEYSLFFTKRVFSRAKNIPDVTVTNFEGTASDIPSVMDSFTGLTSFRYNKGDYSDAYYYVVRRNASTLKALHAEYLRRQNTDDIFFDGDTPIVYPSLKTLSIIFYKEIMSSGISSDTNHFPALKRLHLMANNKKYFELFFNNRSATYDCLEYLEIHGGASIFKLAYDCSSFLLGRLKRLKTAVFHLHGDHSWNIPEDIGNISETSIRLAARVMGMSKKLCRLNIDGPVDEANFVKLLEMPLRFSNIQELKIPDIDLRFSDVLTLMKAAPLLSLLDTRLGDDYPYIEGVEPDGLVRYLEENCADLGKNMEKLYLTCAGRQMDIRRYCISVTLLASLCPRIVHVFTRSFCIKDMRAVILQIFQTKELSKYSECYALLARKIAKPGMRSRFGF